MSLAQILVCYARGAYGFARDVGRLSARTLVAQTGAGTPDARTPESEARLHPPERCPTIAPSKDTVSPPEDETPPTGSDAPLRGAGESPFGVAGAPPSEAAAERRPRARARGPCQASGTRVAQRRAKSGEGGSVGYAAPC